MDHQGFKYKARFTSSAIFTALVRNTDSTAHSSGLLCMYIKSSSCVTVGLEIKSIDVFVIEKSNKFTTMKTFI